MLTGLSSAATALRTADYRQDVVATNLAHMNVPGFRQSLALVTNFAEEAEAQAEDRPGYGKRIETTVNDFSIGPLEQTGRSLDVAIEGDGFFSVQGDGETLYTRNGGFHIGENGILVGSHGMPILGRNGTIRIPNDVLESQIVVSKSGELSANGQVIAQLDKKEGAFFITPQAATSASRILGKGRTTLAKYDNAINDVNAVHPGAPARSGQRQGHSRL